MGKNKHQRAAGRKRREAAQTKKQEEFRQEQERVRDLEHKAELLQLQKEESRILKETSERYESKAYKVTTFYQRLQQIKLRQEYLRKRIGSKSKSSTTR